MLFRSSGYATLGSWRLGDTAGTDNNTLTVTSTGLTGSPITFTASGLVGAFDHLLFTGQPSTSASGVSNTDTITVEGVDYYGNTVPTFTGKDISLDVVTAARGGSSTTISATADVANTDSGVYAFTPYTVTGTAGVNEIGRAHV